MDIYIGKKEFDEIITNMNKDKWTYNSDGSIDDKTRFNIWKYTFYTTNIMHQNNIRIID